MIYLIFIVACLTEQLRADVYTVEPGQAFNSEASLAILKKNPDLIVTFVRDINPGATKALATFGKSTSMEDDETFLESPCNMDTSTHEGTLAAIFWGSLGINSCPVEAGDYPVVSEFNQTGIIEHVFKAVNELMPITFELYSQGNLKYIELDTNVRLVEKNTSG